MSKFSDAKSPLDPRFLFSVEPGGPVINLANGLSSYLAYDSVSGIIKNLVGGQLMQGVGTLDINRFQVAEFFGGPYAWRTSKVTTGPDTIYGHFIGAGAGTINHFSTGMTLSFWFRNNNTPTGAPATGNLARINKVIAVTSGSLMNFNVEPTTTKFSMYNVTSPDGLGEELAFGFNDPAYQLVHALSTRSSVDFLNSPYSFEDFGWGSIALCAAQKPTTLEFQKWHHVVVTISAGDSFTTNGRQVKERANQGSSAVYVNGVLVNKYVGAMDPGVFIKPYGSYPFENLSPDNFAITRKPSTLDKLWFSYDSSTNNRHYTQFCTWNRVLSAAEVEAMYTGMRNGVHTSGVTNLGEPPRKQRVQPSRLTKTVNIGFDDSPGPVGNGAYDDSRSLVGKVNVTLGSNNVSPGAYGISYNPNLDTDLKGQIPAKLAMESVGKLPSEFALSPFSENLTRENLKTHDGTEGTALIRIAINSVTSSRNLQIAGRTDSAMAKRISGTTYGSLFLSSAFRDNAGAYAEVTTPGKPYKGAAGTGFLYYSPQYSTWLEKRSTGNWAFKSVSEKTASERNDAVNSIEVNAVKLSNPGTSDLLTGGYKFASGCLAVESDVGSPGIYASASFSSDFFVTGVNETLAQFSASPQMGYFLPFKESLEHLGYHSIGTPTVTFGAPFAPKYHAYDHETIKLGKYIDKPFRLKKVILRVPVKVVRRNDVTGSTFSSTFNQEWANNVPARKDMDNYVFFLYRQRRTTGEIDSITDVSSSARFLIASASVCVYNSPSFGRAFEDGFSDIFGQNTPISASTGYSTVDEQLNSLYSKMNSLLVDPLLSQSLTRWDSPLHTPAVSIDANLDSFALGSHTFEQSTFLEVELTPAIVQGGSPPASLTYVTSSTSQYSTSFFTVDKFTGTTYSEFVDPAAWQQQGYNRLFNRYPYTGSYTNLTDANTAPPITSVLQNLWLGGTRQPKLSNKARGAITSSNQYDAVLDVRPYFSFMKNAPYTLTQRESFFTAFFDFPTILGFDLGGIQFRKYDEPSFDIELGRTGMSVGEYSSDVFSQPYQIITDGRSVPGAFADKAKGPLPGVFQRTNLIRFISSSAENLDTSIPSSPAYLTASQSSIGTLSGSNMADLVSSMTVGFFTASPNTNKQIVRDYILMPSDELILGLDAGITPPPDVTPTYDDPHPDALGGIDPILEITVP